MKCKKCGRKAVVNLKAYGISLCEKCYPEFYKNLVKRSIKRFGILNQDERVLVAVSGGKDSSAMAAVLKELGYDIELLYIDLGIGEYSKVSEKVVKDLSENLDAKLNVVRLRDYGFTVDDVARRMRRKTCSACGTAKRYIMNRFARENGFEVVATGHTAEDIVSFYIKNVAGGAKVWAEKLMPRNEPFDEKIVARAKPLFEMSEKENMLYVLIENIPYTPMECPHAPKPEWKEIVYEIERRKPGFVKNFVRGLVRPAEEFEETRYCKICGEVASGEICAFCRLKEKLTR
ncbi:MAG: adenine nucleotide alpha hydrolase family protein [Archaeoglobus sp.]|uniref:ATP-binding protein n=1 Tax=Archaeoglobus sp. TaxID=1872626 RepID=UPI001D9F7E61|nr:ATP-binding protein [Archaeoglobus sp.]MBO8180130.1 adenine nucleotide alpha hydrolase family protein [Archaeoglobus sp.]